MILPPPIALAPTNNFVQQHLFTLLHESTNLGADFLHAFRNGEELAFDKLFRAYFSPLTFYANRYLKDQQLSEDIVQDCFVKLWQRRGKLEHVQSIKSYLYRCVYTQVVDTVKKTAGRKVDIDPTGIEYPETENVVEIELMAQILAVLETLPPRMKDVLRMYYLENKTLAEIGAQIGIDPETVRSHRYRAIQLVRKTIITG